MKAITKFCRLYSWLDKNNIEYVSYFREPKRAAYKSDMRLPKYDINIRIERGNETDDSFFQHYKKRLPIIIRDADTMRFIYEKIQNTIIKAMLHQQSHIMKQNKNEDTIQETK